MTFTYLISNFQLNKIKDNVYYAGSENKDLIGSNK